MAVQTWGRVQTHEYEYEYDFSARIFNEYEYEYLLSLFSSERLQILIKRSTSTEQVLNDYVRENQVYMTEVPMRLKSCQILCYSPPFHV